MNLNVGVINKSGHVKSRVRQCKFASGRSLRIIRPSKWIDLNLYSPGCFGVLKMTPHLRGPDS